jgi:uncharacterized YccA/Bax inhibitor family protein
LANPVLTRAFRDTDSIVTTDERMTIGGVGRSSMVLLAIFIPAAVFGWSQVSLARFPSWMVFALLLAIGGVILGAIKPQWTPFIGPVFALVEGAIVGAVSNVYQNAYGEGIVTNAMLATFLTVLVMAVLYATRTVRVTERMRSIVIGATAGIFVFYLVTFGLSFFGVQMPLVWDAGPLGILFSLGVIVLAAFNLLLDFDLIERGVEAGAPAWMNWYAAFGLLVTVVWLYLEILRFLGKLQRR